LALAAPGAVEAVHGVQEGKLASWSGSDHQSLGLLINCLEQIPSLKNPATRRLCLELLNERLKVGLVVDEHPTTRSHLIAIVQACRRQHSRGLSAFIDAVEQLEPGSLAVRRARAALKEITALDLVAERERGELLQLLNNSPGERLAELVRLAAGPAIEMTSSEQHPSEALAALEKMNARSDGVPPLLVFVELLAACFSDERAEKLHRWNDQQAERIGLTEKLTAIRLEQAARTDAAPDVVAYLVIRIEPDLLEPERLILVPWRQHDPLVWRPQRGEEFVGDLDAIRSHVADLVADAESGWAKNAQSIRLEFLLPYALLNLPVDQWDRESGKIVPGQLGLHYQVAVRSLDRARSPRWHREWRRRWELVKRMATGSGACDEHWLWSDGTKPRQLVALDAKLAARREVVSLVLHSVPEGDKPSEVMIGVSTGLPVMIWHRGDSGRAAFETQIKAMRDDLTELVEAFRLLRCQAKQAARPDSHVGSRVSLLWDDPDRPVEPLDPPSAPIEGVLAR
jgi:hypothetical protein